MGWAERANVTPSVEPRGTSEVPAAGPSEFLESVARGMLVDCMRGAEMLQQTLMPPKLVGASGKPLGPQVNPMVVLMQSQIRILHAQAAVLDLLLTFLSGRPELRPVKREEGPADGA